MSLEIRFRARESQTLIWRTTYEVGHSMFWHWIENGYLNKDSLGQFTGRQDREGRWIWTGDVIRGFRQNNHIVRVVETHSFCGWPHIDSEGYELIGNIHDSPELLK